MNIMKGAAALTTCLIVGLALSGTANSQPNVCAALLPEGAYDVITQSKFQSAVNLATQRICSAGATSESQATSIVADIPLGDSGAVLGFKGTGNNFSNWLQQSCQSYYSNNRNATISYDFQKVVSDNAAAIAAACRDVSGVYGYVHRTYPPTSKFALVVRYEERTGNTNTVTLKLGLSDIRCGGDDQPPVRQLVINRGSARTIPCKLTKPGKEPGLITFDQVTPAKPVVVTQLDYNLPPQVAPRKQVTDRRDNVTQNGNTAEFGLDVGTPGWTKVTVIGEGKSNRPGDSGRYTVSASVTIDTLPPCTSSAPASGRGGVGISCERFVYTPTGKIAVRATVGADSGASGTGFFFRHVRADPGINDE